MYEVIVGNIGRIYHGSNWKEANAAFKAYVLRSTLLLGRAYGEDVTMLKDGEFVSEYIGKIRRKEEL